MFMASDRGGGGSRDEEEALRCWWHHQWISMGSNEVAATSAEVEEKMRRHGKRKKRVLKVNGHPINLTERVNSILFFSSVGQLQ